MNIVLLEPEIPHNTGAIGRTCFVTDTRLHLIHPLGFKTDERSLRRSGLDYWKDLDVLYYDNYEDFKIKNKGANVYYATTKASQTYDKIKYASDDFIMFGKESRGIPEKILQQEPEKCVRIPMLKESRSLNLSVSAGIILYEALRQNDFFGLEMYGKFHQK